MKVRHWTPRYVINRIAWGLYQRRNMDKPWLTPQANALLSTLLLPTDNGFEWGSGRSTAWFASKLKHLISIENEVIWYEKIKSTLSEKNISNVDYRLLAVGSGPDDENCPYVRVADSIPNGSLGFVLVDGMMRDSCANAIIPKLMPGGVLVVDNINWFLDHPTYSPGSRVGQGPIDAGWSRFARSVANWRMIWTTSGVADTAIWLKPATD